MATQPSCNCIKITYKIYREEEVSITVYKEPTLYNNRYFYRFLVEGSTGLFRIRWRSTLRWELIRNNTVWGDLDNNSACPFGDFNLISTGAEYFEYFKVENCSIEDQEPTIECYNLLVWKKQCEYSKSVLAYLKQLQFGTTCCEVLDELKNKRRVLNILNCYDPRDIKDDTTDYNCIEYSKIKKLLNY